MMKLQVPQPIQSVSDWVAEETQAGRFADQRLKTRFQKLLVHMAEKIGQSIPLACRGLKPTPRPRIDSSTTIE